MADGTHFAWRADTAATRAAHEAKPRVHAYGSGWRTFVLDIKARTDDDRLSVIAAGVAFYAMLALFPALAALVALYGLALDPRDVTQQVSSVAVMLPPAALELLTQRLKDLATSDRDALEIGATVGLALALWSASAGVRALMKALNVAYDEDEKRGFFRRTGLSLVLTLGAIAGGIVAIVSVVMVPAVIHFLGLGSWLESVVRLARWPIITAMFWLGVLVIYRYGPSHSRVHWTWLNPGAAIATALWLAGSAAFSWYVGTFATYNKTYGSVAGVVVLLMWFLLSAYAVLIGAELNAEMEQRARRAGDGAERSDEPPSGRSPVQNIGTNV